MAKTNRFVNLLVLIGLYGVLALTAQDYVACQDDFPDEFLDFAVICQHLIVPVLAPHLNIRPFPMSLLKIFCFQRNNFQTTLLRC